MHQINTKINNFRFVKIETGIKENVTNSFCTNMTLSLQIWQYNTPFISVHSKYFWMKLWLVVREKIPEIKLVFILQELWFCCPNKLIHNSFLFLLGQRIENSNFKQGITKLSFVFFFYKITHLLGINPN